MWLDSGCTKSLVHTRCVAKGERLGWEIPYSRASSRKIWFPAARVTLELAGKKNYLTVGISPHLPVDMLVGQDVPQLREWLTEEQNQEPETTGGGVTNIALVTTRAQARTLVQEQQLSLATQADMEVVLTDSRIEKNDEGEVEDEPPFNFSDDFFTKTKNSNETRKEKEQEPSLLPDRVSPGELRALQQTDPSMEKVRQQADQDEGPYLWERGLPVSKPFSTEGKILVVVRTKGDRTEILKMAHCSPMACHFGQARTLATIRHSMDWPSLTMDVRNVCMSCPICQRAKSMTTQRAPLHSLPVMSVPFQRVAMDIVGPPKRNKSGNKYGL